MHQYLLQSPSAAGLLSSGHRRGVRFANTVPCRRREAAVLRMGQIVVFKGQRRERQVRIAGDLDRVTGSRGRKRLR